MLSDGDDEPRIAKLSREAKKYRVRAKKEAARADAAEARVEELEAQLEEAGDGAALQAELTVWRRVAEHEPRFVNVADAVALVRAKMDNGTKLGDAIKQVESEYGDLQIRERQKKEAPKGRSGDPNAGRGKRDGSQGLDMAKLRSKYPSLARRVPAR